MLKLIAVSNPAVEVKVKNFKVSKQSFSLIAGPCCIKNEQELEIIATRLKNMGFSAFRAGAYKLRTSPYSYQGLGQKGLEIIKKVSNQTGLASISEIISAEDVDLMASYVDIIMVGTRNMYNYRLLQKLGKVNNPIILKRGMSATYKEWLAAAEYIADAGNKNIILCERGIRTFEPYTRNTLDVSAVPVLQKLSCLPVIVDPSHASGKRELIQPLSLAATAAGANGLLIESHFEPEEAACDKEQTINFEVLANIAVKTEKIRKIITGTA